MNTKFEQTIERPLRFVLNRELLEKSMPIPSSRSFGADETITAAPAKAEIESPAPSGKKCADGKPCQNACCTAARERHDH